MNIHEENYDSNYGQSCARAHKEISRKLSEFAHMHALKDEEERARKKLKREKLENRWRLASQMNPQRDVSEMDEALDFLNSINALGNQHLEETRRAGHKTKGKTSLPKFEEALAFNPEEVMHAIDDASKRVKQSPPITRQTQPPKEHLSGEALLEYVHSKTKRRFRK